MYEQFATIQIRFSELASAFRRRLLIAGTFSVSFFCAAPSLLAHGNEAHVDAVSASSAAAVAGADTGTNADTTSPEIIYQPAPEAMSPQLGGSWSPVYDWPIVAIHAALLPNGKVLSWDAAPDDYIGDPHTTDQFTTRVTLWDPDANSHVATNNDTNTDLFCAGSAHLWDGRILFAGGDDGRTDRNGPILNTNIYEYTTNTWRRTVNMNSPRWYSSVAALGNGEMLTMGGQYSPDPVAEVFQFDQTWRPLGFATPYEPHGYYQWLQATPDGSVISFGPQNQIGSIDTRGGGAFNPGTQRDDVGMRIYGSYAMFDVGKILVAGGANSDDSAIIIDTATQQVTDTGDLNVGRTQHNLTILADGRVLVTGGNSDGSRLVSAMAPIFIPEIWDPQTGQFDTLNPMSADRQYHSIALLLQDGRVLSAGGGICGTCFELGYEERNGATFTPPYLFNDFGELAQRPILQQVPEIADYGAVITATADLDIERAHLIKLGSVTHSENQDQRLVPLAISQIGSTLIMSMPRSRDVAPPGHYLLFALDANGVPSVGAMIRLGQPLVEPGQVVNSTLEPDVFDHYAMPTSGGELQVTLTADQPVSLYLSSGKAVDAASRNEAACRADIPGTRQSCIVESEGPGKWYVTVTGSGRTDYRIDSLGNSPLPDAPPVPVLVPNDDPEPVPDGLGDDVIEAGADDDQLLVTTGGSGGGMLSAHTLLLILLVLVLRLQFMKQSSLVWVFVAWRRPGAR